MRTTVFKTAIRLMMVIACAACVMVACGEAAWAKNLSKRVELVAGKAATVDLGDSVSDVLVANPSIVDVGTLRSSRLYLVGKQVGDTNVLAFDGDGNQLADIAVHVKVDQASLSSALREFFPDESVDVRTINNNIVLSGTASNALAANRIRDLASRFVTGQGQTIVDLMGVRGEQQVMLKVKVLEARRSVLREFGIETDYRGRLNSNSGIGMTALQPFATGSLIFDDNNKFGPLRMSLQALERDGLVNTLAEPNLTAISGETAGFLAGGEFPVPVGTTDDGNTVTLQFKQFGVSLNFTPTVLTEENISLHLATEVSALADDLGLTLSGVDIPGLTVRRAETTVEMSSGGSIMIAGLIQSGTTDNYNSLPGLGKLPILGDLFKSKSFQRDESELIILITPYLVKPFAEPQAEMAGLGQPEPSPIPPARLPALNADEMSVDRQVRDFPEARPVRSFQGESRTQGMEVPVTPRGRAAPTAPALMKQGQFAPAKTAPAAVAAAPVAPVETVKAEKLVADVKAQEAAVAVKTPAPVAPTKAASSPSVAGKESQQPNGLSRQFVRNLQATYGAKAVVPAPGQQAFGYIVD